MTDLDFWILFNQRFFVTLPRYFCHDGCCFGCCSGGKEFIDEADGCQELSVIDRLREKADRQAEDDEEGEAGLATRVTTALLTPVSMVRDMRIIEKIELLPKERN